MTEKKQKTRDFAALERCATKKPWTRLKLAPSIKSGGCFTVATGIVGILTGLWVYSIIVAVGIVGIIVGMRDSDIRTAKWWYDQVIDGPGEQLQARAARSISIRSVATPPALLVGGGAWLNIVFRLGLSFPGWTLLIWLIPFVVSLGFFLRTLGKIEAYQRDKERIKSGGADE